MLWWHWLVIGLILIALEMAASGGFYVIFFGIAALVIASLHAFDAAGPVWTQLLLFSALSIGLLLFFRNRFLKWMKLDAPSVDLDSLVGDTAIPVDDIAPGAVGRAELRGTAWSARNAWTATLVRGQRCTVVDVDRLTIFLEPERERS